ncbi:MAG: glycosyltransferase [bacterium]|nr:glycosyltransferase [bacterium]
MSIPKVIYQTFKTADLPFITQWHIARLKKKNPDYKYEFYDDQRIEDFIAAEYSDEVLSLYQKIDIGAAKADFFRYAILYKRGGIYLDIDSLAIAPFHTFIKENDEALIAMETHPGVCVQWALIFASGHPFLKKAMDLMIDNLKHDAFPNDVHSMTGPTVYTAAITACLKSDHTIPYGLMGVDYQGCFKFHYHMSKFFLYRGLQHWKKAQLSRTVLRQGAEVHTLVRPVLEELQRLQPVLVEIE